jgi:hypothetical protein
MELERLYRYLKERPRDARWMLRKLGPDYLDRVEALRAKGWPVACKTTDENGLHRVLFVADDQAELFPVASPKRRRRRRSPRAIGLAVSAKS